MINNNNIIYNQFKIFNDKINNNDFVIDKNGTKTVEQIGVQLRLNSKDWYIDLGVKKTNTKYVKQELKWYLSKSRSINDGVGDIKIWQQVSDENGYINSNYGWCIFSNENGNQFSNVIKILNNNPDSRQASIIYTRPSMHEDWNRNGMSDFMCTNNTQHFIRNNKLIYIIHQRSCDLFFGYFNDFAWHCFVQRKMFNKLKSNYNKLEYGDIIYNIDSLHVYERHFELIKKVMS